MANPQQQPLPFEALQQWISDFVTNIDGSVQRFLGDRDFYEDLEVANNLPLENVPQGPDAFLALKEEHHEFEHFLCATKYDLANEKFKIITNLPEEDPRRLNSIIAIESLEKIIQNYLARHPRSFCQMHQNHYSEEINLNIQTHSELAVIEHRQEQELLFQIVHKERIWGYEPI
ncbi:hypothetical protein BDA99DRAFT_561436 [Phascolomyces articulosus]|uniref:Uncharacterized protein n=1 Tax=Phascolomyces articulosus TaxID=60185 RepID=A0AAD5JWQ8_9FUNG|nr:hypothetical protein BDA99DRAFT_561436 [Phascolomyces articulosus]